jgi:hypothetical protein
MRTETGSSKRREATLIKKGCTVIKWSVRIGMCFVVGACAAVLCSGQDRKVTQTAGVDNTRMGAYRALAQLSFQTFQKGDNTTAAELARILERTWDQGEWKNSGDGSFCKGNRAVCQPIDRALDEFIRPVMNYMQKAPDPAIVRTAYSDFLDKLKQAD